MKPLRVAFLTTDGREMLRQYDGQTPILGTAPQALLQGFAKLPGIEVHVVSCLQKRVRSVEALADNVRFHALHVPKIGWMRTLYQGSVRAIRRWVRENQPDIVHGQGTERDCAISTVHSGAVNLLTIHGNMRRLAAVAGSKPFSFAWLSARLEAWVLPRTQGVLCLSTHARKQVQPLARRTWLVPNAVDPGFLDKATVPVTPPQLVCVANVMPVKNQNQLIRSLDPLAKQLPFKLVFIGNANYDEPFGREFIGLIRNRPWCHHRGFADRESLKAALAVSSALVLPSLEENCPMAVLEAMAAGVPVLAAQVGGVPDLIKDGATGLLFDPNNPEQIRTGVQRILSEPRLAGELARRARQEIDLRFTPEVVARRHMEIYRELLESVGTR